MSFALKEWRLEPLVSQDDIVSAQSNPTLITMLTIKRTCANKIMTHALKYEHRVLIATLQLDAEDCEICDGIEQLQQRLDQDSGIAIVHNQHVEAINQVMSIDTPLDQLFVEIRQDTKGVLGLHASYKNSHQLETLELLS